MQVLDKGELRLMDFMGGDMSVIRAARVSNDENPEDASKGREKDKKLINYLMKHQHHTPFEHTVFQFYIQAPLFVVREWHRHRMASYNEVSGRYVNLAPIFYFPDRIRVPADTNKQGSVFRPGNPNVDDQHFSGLVQEASADAFRRYEELISIGAAKELARIVLPLNLYTRFYMTVNARALMNFLSLRSADDAQWEIRQYSLAMQGIFAEKMPMTYEAYEEFGYGNYKGSNQGKA
jgi:thymidylate synthase (FAD)